MKGLRHAFHPLAPFGSLPALLILSAAAKAGPPREQVEFFEKKIRPVLVEHCYQCHSAGAKRVRGGLLLDTRAGARKGGDTGPAVVPGDPDASLLLKALRYDELKMPPAGKLPAQVVADIETWIKQGAADPRAPTVAETGPRTIDIERGKRFWSFRPPRRHEAPPVQNRGWPLRKVDPFILARLEQAGLSPSAPADRRTWLRRVTFNLTGLPPTPEAVEAFVKDTSPPLPKSQRLRKWGRAGEAYEAVVERLLASPHYGERWARLWLDLARYAEDQAHIVGENKSLFYPNAYLYRDWVIKALNEDMPYDRFVKMQLAADLIEPDDPASHAALGFLGLGPKYYGRGSPKVKADEWEDRVDTVSRGLLGLTVACARCHDHKFDPIPTDDYYALAGVFAGTEMFNRPLDPKAETKDNGQAKRPKDAMHIVREGTPTDLNVFVRGDINNKGPVVKRRFLQVLSAGEPKPFERGSGRLGLAKAIASRDNPLTARVIVNRVWGAHFGRPLVGTPSNFGALGERPTHPDLLDDLAVRFMESGWSLKWLQREIVLSAVYRQEGRADSRTVRPHFRSLQDFGSGVGADSRTESADPENRLLGRMSRRRLGVEAWRDALLSAAGRLDHTVGGRSIDPRDPDETRRTVYSRISRLDLNRMLALFDFPDPNVHAGRRVRTTTPLQKLFILNSPFMVAQAEALAGRLEKEVPPETPEADRRRIERAYLLLYGRPARDAEVRLGLEFLEEGDKRPARWRQYAHVLLAANEMMFID